MVEERSSLGSFYNGRNLLGGMDPAVLGWRSGMVLENSYRTIPVLQLSFIGMIARAGDTILPDKTVVG